MLQLLSRLRWQRLRQVHWQTWVVLLVALAALCLFGHFRHRYVGGCDPTAYLNQSLLIRGQDAGLVGSWDPGVYPALAPLCHQVIGHNIEPIFPVGFPLLLALAGVVGLEFFILPFCGAASILLLYMAVAHRAGRTIGLVLAVLWAITPTVVWGATTLMSDLPAAFTLLLCYVLWQRGRVSAAGATLGFSLAVRPTNLLFLPVLLLPLFRARQLRRFLQPFAIVVAIWVAYSMGKFNAPLPPAYSTNLNELTAGNFLSQLGFFAGTTAAMLPPLLVLAAIALLRRPARAWPELFWFGSFLLFYSLWRRPLHEYWWTRFLLPAYPALFLLAGDGLQELAAALRGRLSRWAKSGLAVLGGFGLLLPTGWYSWRKVSLSTHMDDGYLEDSLRVAKTVPRYSLVGAMNLSGPLRLYGKVESFCWDQYSSVALMERALKRGWSVFVILDPMMSNRPEAQTIRQRFFLKKVIKLSTFPNLWLEQVEERGFNIQLGRRGGWHKLLQGWSNTEEAYGQSWVWAVAKVSTMKIKLPRKETYDLALQAWSFDVPGRQQQVEIRCNGQPVTTLQLTSKPESYRFQLPAAVVKAGENVLSFHHAYAVSPRSLGLSQDGRTLAVAYESLRVRRVHAPDRAGAHKH